MMQFEELMNLIESTEPAAGIEVESSALREPSLNRGPKCVAGLVADSSALREPSLNRGPAAAQTFLI